LSKSGKPYFAFLIEKKSLNEEDFPLFTQRRCPFLALRSGWQGVPQGFLLPPK
jgi:hypothetical protein